MGGLDGRDRTSEQGRGVYDFDLGDLAELDPPLTRQVERIFTWVYWIAVALACGLGLLIGWSIWG